MYKGKIISEIEALNGAFTKSEYKIKNFLSHNLLNVIHLSVTELSEEVAVGETTIVRFCQKLGYKGFHDFKLAIAQDDTLRKQEEVNSKHMSEVVFANIVTVLEDSKNLIDQTLINRSIQLIQKAEHVYFIGVGGSGITAQEAHSKFFRVSPKFHVLTDSHFQMMAAQIMTPRDVIVVLTLSGSTKDIVDAVHEAKKNGTKVISITNFKKSPITKFSDLVLLTSGKIDSMNGGSLVEKISQLYVVDILFSEFIETNRLFEENRKRTALSVSSKKY